MPSENNKRIAKNSLMLYIRMFFTMLVGFYTSRVVLNELGVVDYGIYNVVGGIVGALAILNGAMAGSTQRWITFALGKGDEEYLKKVFGVGLTAQAIIAVAVLLLVETIGVWYLYTYAVIPAERMDTAFWVFQISMFTMLVNILNVPFQGAIIAHEKMGMFAFFSITDVVMKLVICVALHFTDADKLLVYALLLFVALIINFFWMQIYCHRNFVEAKLRFLWDGKLYREMGSLAFWTISGNLAYVGYSQGVTLLINLFFGPAMNAAAGVAAQANNIVLQFGVNFQNALNPQITKYYAQQNYAEMHKLMFRAMRYSFFLMLFFAIPLFYEAPFLLKVWLGNVPEHSPLFVRIGLFVTLLMIIRNPLIVAAMANGHLRKYQIVVNGIMLLVSPILYIIYKMGGIPEASSIVFFLVMLVAVFASAALLKEMVKLNFRDFVTKVVLKVCFVSILSFPLPYFIYSNFDEGWGRLVLLTAFSFVVVGIVVYFLGMENKERFFVMNQIECYFKHRCK